MDRDEPSVRFQNELDVPVATALRAMLAETPDASLVRESLETVLRQGPEPMHMAARPGTLVRRGSRLAAAAAVLLAVMWLTSQTTAWGQVARSYLEQESTVDLSQPSDPAASPATVEDPEVGSGMRFLLLLHVFSLVAGYVGLGIAWVLALVELRGSVRSSSPPERPARWRVRIHRAALGVIAGGLLLGSVWANAAWGVPWAWKPRETAPLFVLLVGGVWYLGTTPVLTTDSTRRVLRRATLAAIAFWTIVLIHAVSVPDQASMHAYGSSASPLPAIVAALLALNLLALFALARRTSSS